MRSSGRLGKWGQAATTSRTRARRLASGTALRAALTTGPVGTYRSKIASPRAGCLGQWGQAAPRTRACRRPSAGNCRAGCVTVHARRTQCARRMPLAAHASACPCRARPRTRTCVAVIAHPIPCAPRILPSSNASACRTTTAHAIPNAARRLANPATAEISTAHESAPAFRISTSARATPIVRHHWGLALACQPRVTRAGCARACRTTTARAIPNAARRLVNPATAEISTAQESAPAFRISTTARAIPNAAPRLANPATAEISTAQESAAAFRISRTARATPIVRRHWGLALACQPRVTRAGCARACRTAQQNHARRHRVMEPGSWVVSHPMIPMKARTGT